jgi:hypothetical protein
MRVWHTLSPIATTSHDFSEDVLIEREIGD